MESKHLELIKGRIDSLTVAIQAPATTPKKAKKTVRIGGITLAPIVGGSTPAMTPRGEQDSTSVLEDSSESRVRSTGKTSSEKCSPAQYSAQSNLKLSFRLPKLEMSEAKAKIAGASPSSSKSTPKLARSASLLLTPTASPMKLGERSRSGLIMDSPTTTSPDSRRPINAWRAGPTSQADSVRTLQAPGDNSLSLERSSYYERKDTIADVLMEWDYQRKAFIMTPR